MKLNSRLSGRLSSRFDSDDEDPRASLVNLVDVMLVFSCGLLAALTAGGHSIAPPQKEITRGKEISTPASGKQSLGSGYQAVGQVYRDAKTGKLLLIEDTGGPSTGASATEKLPAAPAP